VVDCATLRVLAVVPLRSSPEALVLHPTENKLYCALITGASGLDSVVAVVCTRGDSVLKHIKTESGPMAMCIDSTLGKLYCAHYQSSKVTVVDLSADSVIGSISVVGYSGVLRPAPDRGKVYCLSASHVRVIDCSVDSVVADVRVLSSTDLCYCAASGEVYVVGDGKLMTIIDAGPDTVVRTVAVTDYNGTVPKFVISGDDGTRVYVAIEDKLRPKHHVAVVDLETDSVVARIRVGFGPHVLKCAPGAGRVWCASRDANVTVIDCESASIAGVIWLGASVTELLSVPETGKVFCLDAGHLGAMSVLPEARSEEPSLLCVGQVLSSSCYDSRTGKVYTGVVTDSSLCVVDQNGGSILFFVRVSRGPQKLALNTPLAKLYCGSGSQSVVDVVSVDGDTVCGGIRVDEAMLKALLVAPTENKLYILLGPNSWRLLIADCRSDSILADIPFGWGALEAMCYSSVSRKVYVLGSKPVGGRCVYVVDAAGDSLVKELVLGGSHVCAKIAWVPWTNEVLVTESESYHVDVIACSSDTVVGAIMVNGFPEAVIPVPSSEAVFCATTNGIKVVDMRTRGIVQSFPDVSAQCFTFSPATGRVYAADWAKSWVTVFRSAAPGVEEDLGSPPEPSSPGTRFIRGSVFLPLSPAPGAHVDFRLIDTAGRRVLGLRPGFNSTEHLCPGVYFLRCGTTGRVRKLVVTR
jgi:DNA-binding beta-propeller fold protein YncE